MFSPTRLQVKHVLKAHCFGKDEQFSVAIARDFLERVILHTSWVNWMNLEQLEKNSVKSN